ncbi:MAG: hypothetical protein ACLPKI_22205 [Streptosporangiaceae bacterium]
MKRYQPGRGTDAPDTPGVVSYVPADAAEKLAVAFGPDRVSYRPRSQPPAFRAIDEGDDLPGQPGRLDNSDLPGTDSMYADDDDEPAAISAAEWSRVRDASHTHDDGGS